MLAAAALAVLFVNVVGFWLWHEGRQAGADGPLASLTTFIIDNLRALKSGMTILAVIVAAFATFSMRAAIVDSRRLSPEPYRRLRQTHRLAGYAALVTAFAIGLFTCVGLFGFQFSSVRVTLHTVFGTALLVMLVFKVATVRYLPRYRHRLDWLGGAVFALFILVLLTSTVPYLWERLTGGDGGYGY